MGARHSGSARAGPVPLAAMATDALTIAPGSNGSSSSSNGRTAGTGGSDDGSRNGSSRAATAAAAAPFADAEAAGEGGGGKGAGGGGKALADYLALPVNEYVLLDPSMVTRCRRRRLPLPVALMLHTAIFTPPTRFTDAAAHVSRCHRCFLLGPQRGGRHVPGERPVAGDDWGRFGPRAVAVGGRAARKAARGDGPRAGGAGQGAARQVCTYRAFLCVYVWGGGVCTCVCPPAATVFIVTICLTSEFRPRISKRF